VSPAAGTIRKTRLSPCHQPAKVRAEAVISRRRPERSRAITADHQMPIRNPQSCHCEPVRLRSEPALSEAEWGRLRGNPSRNREIGFVLHVSSSAVGPTGPIGFVLHNRRGGSEAAGRTADVPPQVCPQSTIRNREIGFVLHVSLPGRPTPHTTTAFARIPQSPQVWVRFARFPPSAACAGAELGSFRTFTLRPGQIGFVSHNRHGGSEAASCRTDVSPQVCPQSTIGKLGSFCMFYSPAEPRPHANRLCPYAPVSPSLASFRTVSSGTAL
jgi:hypothetical protein